jgi:hypothetical protein
MALTEDDDVVETVPPYGSHKAFSIWILPRRLGCRKDFFDAETVDAAAELVAVDTIAVADHVLERRVLGERLDDLLGGRGRAGVLGDAEVRTWRRSWAKTKKTYRTRNVAVGTEEIDRCQRADVVVEEGAPGFCEGGFRGLGGMKRDTLRSPMSIPSLSNSPWILGAPPSPRWPRPSDGRAVWSAGRRRPSDGPGNGTSIARTGGSRRGASGPRCLA